MAEREKEKNHVESKQLLKWIGLLMAGLVHGGTSSEPVSDRIWHASTIVTELLSDLPLGFPRLAHESRNVIPPPAKTILEYADRLELLSLDPRENQNGGFHGFTVLTAVAVTNSETRKTLVLAFERAVTENQGEIAACFNPRHGLRACKGDKQEEFVIWFQCLQVKAYGEARSNFLVSASAAPVFDEVLRQSVGKLPSK